ncbi:general substrate transporter [Aspergillus sergii]|uniref:General substrate transporter n=1 Tax=Aspergillus sergii TaxID=1034303 RepID=A0A5N6X7C2_9EURO|nr:general substrate transporter [Aspergillus sergii]
MATLRGQHGNSFKSLLTALAVSLGGIIYGIDSGIIATTISHDSFKYYMYHSEDAPSGLSAAIVSSYYAGGCIGSLVVGWLMDHLSRRYSLLAGAIVSVIGAIVQTAAQNAGMMIAGRAVSGISTGILFAVTPVYLSELSPKENRAFLGGLKGLMTAFGFFLSNWIGYAGSFASGNAQWRIPLAMQLPPAILLAALTRLLPFSPRWLVQQERHDDAKAVLERLHSNRGHDWVQNELQEIITQVAQDAELRKKNEFFALFTPKYFRRTFLAIWVANVSKLSGSVVIQNYQSLMYTALGFSGRTLLLIAGCYGLMGVLGQILNLVFVSDRWERTKTLYIGSLALCCILATLAALSKFYPDNRNLAGSSAGVAFIFLFSGVFAVFFNSTGWILASELFPLHLRANGVGFAIFTTSITAIWLTQVTPLAFEALAWKFYLIFIAYNLFSAGIYYFLLPETNQLSLEEIGALFGDEVAPDPKAVSGNVKQFPPRNQRKVVHRFIP